MIDQLEEAVQALEEAETAAGAALTEAEEEVKRARAEFDRINDARHQVEALLSPRVEAQEAAAEAPPTSPPSPNSEEAKEPSSPPPSPSVAPSPSRAVGSKQEQARRKQAAVDLIVRIVSEIGGRVSRGQIQRATDFDLSVKQFEAAASEAVRAGRLERVGKKAGTRYVAVETKTPVTPAAERKQPGPATEPPRGTERAERQAPSLEGRILTRCQVPTSGPALSLALETSLNELRPVLSKMMREGDLRTQRRGGEIHYSAVMM